MFLAGSADGAKGLIFPQIDTPKEGSYELSVAYLRNASPANTLFVVVNDATSQCIKVESEHGVISLTARFHSGRNKVEIQSSKPINMCQQRAS